MGGGKERKASMDMQAGIARDQLATSKQYLDLATQEQGRRNTLQQPTIDFYSKIVSGDPNARMTAAAVPLGDIARGARGARESIMDSVPRGAGRDFALAQNENQKYSQSADYLNKAFMGAFPALSGLGTEAGQVGLQNTGAGMRGAEAAANTNQGVMQSQAQTKAAQLGVLGSLAGAAGGVVTGGFMPKKTNATPQANPVANIFGQFSPVQAPSVGGSNSQYGFFNQFAPR